LITVTVRAVSEGSYRPQQLMIELGLGKTQFCKWVNALGLSEEGRRKHIYTEQERTELLRFRNLLNQYRRLEEAFDKWQEQAH